GVAATGTFGVEGVDHTTGNRTNRVFHETALVQRIGVDGHLNIHQIRGRERAVNRGVRGTPVFVEFQPDGTGANLLGQRIDGARVTLTQQADVDRQVVHSLQHF